MMGVQPIKAVKDAVRAEREACAAYIEAKAGGYSELLARGRVSAETVDHVARVCAAMGDDLRNGFHLQEVNDAV